MAKNITPKDLADVTKEGLTLVDFWAEWCGPCKMMNPVLEELEKDYQGKVEFAKVDVDKYQDLAMEYKIMSIPAMILFKDGVAKEKVVGFHPKKDMANYLDEKLAEVEQRQFCNSIKSNLYYKD